MDKYQPISCVYYDLLEHYATLKQSVEVVYYLNDKKKVETGVIQSLTTTKDKVEIMVVNEREIRLDTIFSVDGKLLSDFTRC